MWLNFNRNILSPPRKRGPSRLDSRFRAVCSSAGRALVRTAPRGRRGGNDKLVSNQAVTLIEMLTVLGLLALLGSILTFMFGSMDKSYLNIKSSLDLYQNARVTLARLNREISETVFDNSGSAALGLKGVASDLSFHALYSTDSFSSDDNSSDVVAIRIAFDPANKKIIRYIKNSTATDFPTLPVDGAVGSDLAQNIEALSIDYFDKASDFESGTGQAAWDSGAGAQNKLPALIRIRLTLTDSKGLARPKDFETVIYLRSAI